MTTGFSLAEYTQQSIVEEGEGLEEMIILLAG